MILRYKLSSDLSEATDLIAYNVLSKKNRLYEVMKNFSIQSQNNGVYAENILRITLDGVNLNHLYKNHPHVDIAIPPIAKTIEGVTQKNEIISVKSSISKNSTLATVLRDTKSIKLESVFSYVVFASTNFKLDYEKEFFAAKSLYNLGFKLIKKDNKISQSSEIGDNKDYKAVLNTTLYYLLYKNKEGEKENYINDIITISNSAIGENYKLIHGNYATYRVGVLRRISALDAPISLGAVYLKNDNGDLTCYIHKTNPISLGRYWEDIVSIWLKGKNDKSFFDFSSEKYLDYSLVKKLYNIETRDFPIQIRISIDGFVPKKADYSDKTEQEKIAIRKQQIENKTSKLHTATKLQYADFKGKEKDINDFFLKSIDILEKRPSLITSFNQFINSIETPAKLERFKY
jgi:hypothetical protein